MAEAIYSANSMPYLELLFLSKWYWTLAVALGEGERIRDAACSAPFSTPPQRGQGESAQASVACSHQGRRKRPHSTPLLSRPYASGCV